MGQKCTETPPRGAKLRAIETLFHGDGLPPWNNVSTFHLFHREDGSFLDITVRGGGRELLLDVIAIFLSVGKGTRRDDHALGSARQQRKQLARTPSYKTRNGAKMAGEWVGVPIYGPVNRFPVMAPYMAPIAIFFQTT